MKILLTGSKGQLGLCFQDRLPQGWDCLALDSAALDISSREAVLAVVCGYQPDVIVNAAAYTAVDKAEGDAVRATAVNAHGPENLAFAANEVQARFVHISTDYVFDGSADVPYLESDAVNPLGVYGKSKLAGELLAQLVHPQAIIIRTAWVFSEYGNNFVKTMLRLAQDRPELGVVSDQRGCPTYAGDIAAVIISMIQQQAVGGVYHYCGDVEVSWAEFAQAIFKKASSVGKLSNQPKVNFIKTQQYPTPAKRPSFSALSTDLISDFYPASNWSDALNLVVSKL